MLGHLGRVSLQSVAARTWQERTNHPKHIDADGSKLPREAQEAHRSRRLLGNRGSRLGILLWRAFWR